MAFLMGGVAMNGFPYTEIGEVYDLSREWRTDSNNDRRRQAKYVVQPERQRYNDEPIIHDSSPFHYAHHITGNPIYIPPPFGNNIAVINGIPHARVGRVAVPTIIGGVLDQRNEYRDFSPPRKYSTYSTSTVYQEPICRPSCNETINKNTSRWVEKEIKLPYNDDVMYKGKILNLKSAGITKAMISRIDEKSENGFMGVIVHVGDTEYVFRYDGSFVIKM